MSGALRVLAPGLALCGLVVALDQGTKGLVNSALGRGESAELLPFLAIENTRNRGVAFGLGGDASPLLIALTLVALLALLAYLTIRAKGPSEMWLPAGLLVGGALGNLADRVRQGAVTDFIDLPLWPTFNLADVAIVAGVILLVWRARGAD